MNDVGKNKRVPLIVLLVVFAICNIFDSLVVNEYLSRATTSFYERDFFSTYVSFSEDIECVSPISLVSREIDEALGNKELSKIKTLTIQKGKKYKLKSDFLIVVRGKKRDYRDQIKLVLDDHESLPVDLYSADGKTKEFHDESLDGTYYTEPPMSKVESYEELLSEYKKARNDFIASQHEKINLTKLLHSIIIPLTVSIVISGIVLLIHRLLMVKGRSATPLVITVAILDVPMVVFAVFLLVALW